MTLVPVATSIAPQVEAFLSSLDRADETRRSYGSSLRTFASWLALDRPGTPREKVLAFKTERLGTCSAATVSRDIAAIRAFSSWCMAEGLTDTNPTDGVKTPKTSKLFKRGALSLDEAIRLVDSIDGSTPRGARDAAMVALMVRAGLRDVEVSRAEVSDLKTLNGCRVLWTQGKGADAADQFIVVNERAGLAIDRYLSLCPHDGPLFVATDGRGKGRLSVRQVCRIVSGRLADAGLRSDASFHSPHALRHSAATLALEAGVPITEVSAMLRHKDIKVTMVYVHMRNRTQYSAESALNF